MTILLTLDFYLGRKFSHMNSSKIQFPNSENELLAARLELPVDKKASQYAIFAHCFTCNKNLTAVRAISRALTQKGIGVLRFDFTGLGESEGEFSDTNFSSNVSDLISAHNFLKDNYNAPTLVIGHSLGGAAALITASTLDSIQAVVTIGSPSDPKHVVHLFDESIEQINAQGRAQVNIGGRPFEIKQQFLSDLKEKNMPKIVKSIRKPLLILHSPQDNTVEVKNAAEIYGWAHHPKSFVSLDGADHLLSDKQDALYVGDVIGSWSDRYLPQPKTKTLKSTAQVLARSTEEKFTTEILAEGFSFVADEPKELGGNEFGPSPYSFVASGLAACTAMTIKMYAQRKGWNIEKLDVEVNHGKDYAKDCEDCESPKTKIDQFERIISIEGDFSEKELNRMLEIANKCPVHKTLEATSEIKTRLK